MTSAPRRTLLLLGFLGCAHAAAPAPGAIPAARAPIEGSQALEHIRYLASDELEGRGVRTPGIQKAAAYIAEAFRRDGLEPLGDHGSYLQSFDVPVGGQVKDGAVAVGSERLAAGSDFVVLGWSSTGRLEAPAVFAGYGVTDPQAHWDDYAKLDARGKVVVVLRKLPKTGGLSDKLADVREKIANAKKHGAVGFVLVNRPQEDDDDFMRVREAGDDYGLVTVQAKRRAVEKLFGAPLADLEKEGPGRSGPRLALQATVERQTEHIANVVGMVRGSDPALARQYVVLGSHYDHLGRGFPKAWSFACKGAKQGLIFHGADDNASGTAGMMEIAEAFAADHPRPKRSVVFVAFTGEEMGLLGSRHFVEHPPVPLADVVAMINLDMIGRLRDAEGISLEGAATAPEWRPLVDAANVEKVRLSGSKSLMEDSDHASFYRRDLPVLFFFTGLHPQYHCHTDTVDLINADGLARVARLCYRVMRKVADAGAPHAGLTFTKVAVSRRGGGSFHGPRLGIAPDYGSQGGLGVAAVIDGGAAAKAGLRPGDLITMLGGKEIANIDDYMAALAAHKPGEVIDIRVRRGAESLSVKAQLEGSATP